MMDQYRKKRASAPVLGKALLSVLGLVIALGLVEMLMREFPNWIPPEVRVNPPARRVKAFVDERYDLRQSDGDLFHYMKGKIVPMSPHQDRVVANVHMITDANGFRNSPPEKDAYEVVALGDSFTRSSGVALAWTQILAENTGSDVLNLADVGFGPQDELKVLQQYGLKKHPQWVIMAYFEGNDLYDAAAYDQATPFILFRFGRYILGQSVAAWQDRRSSAASTVATSDYRYPITMMVNHKEFEMVFFPSYISWLSLSRETITVSQNYRLVRDTILEVQESSKAADANFLLVYVPSKSHVYLPYMNNPETVASVFTGVSQIELDDRGFLQFTNKTVTPDLVRQHMDDQANLLADLAAEHNMHYLDLTTIFQEEAGSGAQLYYTYDTHWNQLGHNLAAEAINEYLKVMLSSRTPGN